MNYGKIIKKFKAENGVSLLELIVSMAIFAVLILAATGIFKLALDGQRGALAARNAQENMRYAMEKMNKEIRMAQKSDAECFLAGINKVFNTDNSDSELYFKNQYGDCLKYYLENNRLKIMASNGGAVIADDFITPAKLEISNLKFLAVDDLIGAFPSVQPYITMKMDIKAGGQGMHKQKMKIQMTASSRYYE